MSLSRLGLSRIATTDAFTPVEEGAASGNGGPIGIASTGDDTSVDSPTAPSDDGDAPTDGNESDTDAADGVPTEGNETTVTEAPADGGDDAETADALRRKQ